MDGPGGERSALAEPGGCHGWPRDCPRCHAASERHAGAPPGRCARHFRRPDSRTAGGCQPHHHGLCGADSGRPARHGHRNEHCHRQGSAERHGGGFQPPERADRAGAHLFAQGRQVPDVGRSSASPVLRGPGRAARSGGCQPGTGIAGGPAVWPRLGGSHRVPGGTWRPAGGRGASGEGARTTPGQADSG